MNRMRPSFEKNWQYCQTETPHQPRPRTYRPASPQVRRANRARPRPAIFVSLFLTLFMILISTGCDLFFEGVSIRYYGNRHEGGSTPTDMKRYAVGESVILRANDRGLSREGYTFSGWKTDPYGGRKDYSPGHSYYIGEKYEAISFYAHWEPVTYPIRYQLNGGIQDDDNPAAYTVNSWIHFDSPRKDGALFEGWYLDEACTQKIYRLDGELTGPITLHAHWNNRTYSIRYHLDGGLNDPRNPAQITPDDAVPRLYAPAHDRRDFLGWYLDSEHRNPVTSLPEGTHSHINLYAAWQPRTTMIQYHANNGTGDTDTQPADLFTDAAVADFNFALPKQYTFLHWTADSAVAGVSYAPGDVLPVADAPIRLYAQFAPEIYEISCEHTQGAAVSIPASYTVEDDPIELAPLMVPGFDFRGWFLNYDSYYKVYSSPIDIIDPSAARDFTLYAQFEPKTYRIYAHYQDPLETKQSWLRSFDTECTIDPLPADNPGYVFAGWALSPGGEAVYKEEFTLTVPNHDVHLYGVWRPRYETSSTGPAGGRIIYDKGSYDDGWRYIEMAPDTVFWEDKPWGGLGYDLGYLSSDYGRGKENTELIVQAFGDREPYAGRYDYAAKLCDDLVLTRDDPVFNDWFLPSRSTSSHIHNTYISEKIWSSNSYGSDQAYTINDRFGAVVERPSRSALRTVRPVRRF